ncbi:MAG: hypothetical protein KF721_08465 [Ignavibacteriaceae bacterium]|nr:hypothetical protein [Ignavibacteriaceae bacterium]
MKNKYLFYLLVVFIGTNVSYADSLFIAPSYFFTYGNYNNNSSSVSNALYLTSYLSSRVTLINHYDNLSIDLRKDTAYLQNTLHTGFLLNLYPYYFKFHYAYKQGEYSISDSSLYSDYTNLYSLETMYYQNMILVGLSLTHINSNGILNSNLLNNQKINQLTLRLDYTFSPSLLFSLKPNYTNLTDGRRLYSVASRITFFPINSLAIKLFGFAGERAYYFDNDLLTNFNQDETQKSQIGVQLDYYPSYYTLISAGFQYTKFTSFTINYFFIGIRHGLFI